jgi:hypothetical protein
MSALPPSAAIVNAVRHVDFAASGKLSNSLSAALIHETGRVLLVIGEFHHEIARPVRWPDVVIIDNIESNFRDDR